MPSPIPSTSIPAREEWEGNVCVLTYDALDVDAITRSVGDDRAGANVVFVGTTRNSFRGKVVARLEYQAYSKLAIRTMTEIVIRQLAAGDSTSHTAASTIISCAVHHRLGTVPVGEASIVIAVSSPHRKEAFVACEQILEEVKEKAPIWKREYYDGEDEETAEWKANYS
ncbi:molybdenum cofactor synthesis 2 [Scleroderma citrinum]